MEFISWIIGFLLQWYVWLPAVLFLGYMTWKNYQRIDAIKAIDSTLLILEIPKANDKSEMAAEQLFASLHGILRDKEELKINGGIQEHLSFEIASVNGQIRFYVWVPKSLQSFVEGQIYAQYPSVQIHEADEDYVAHERQHSITYTGEITLTDSEFLPIKSFQSFEVDPLAGITGTLAKPKEVSERNKTRIAEAEKKATKLGYQVKIRLAYLGESQTNAKLRMQAIVGTFKQYNSTNLNGFKVSSTSFKKEDLAAYRARLFIDKGYILNIEEVASVFHLPHTNVETPNIVWASSKTAEPPAKLPVITGNAAIDENISAFGMTNFRGMNHQFGMLRYDRSRHVYIIGQTGAGKSGTLELFALSDIFHKQGYAIIDPHGDFAVNNMKFIPADRAKDVVYFNPADTAFPLGFNPLEVTNPSQKSNISSEVIGVLKRMFGESWGPRLEYILRYTILALLDRPETTMLDITRMLTDKKFRKETLASTFNIRKMMDEGQILIVNLSKGLIGEDNAGILGSFLVTKIQLAAMSRSDIPDIKDRRPFYLYVDEFQNFATDSFATILSEARKYGLNLTVANQYISQMNDTVRDAVFGNVGTMITFRVSADDAPILVKQFEPQFESNDLLQMHNRNFVINMVIGGEKTPAFSARTLQLPPPQIDNSQHIIDNTRMNYSRSREDVEREISDAIQPPENLQKKKPAPQSASQAKQWPIDAANTPVQPSQPNKPRIVVDTPAGEAALQQPARDAQPVVSQQGSGSQQQATAPHQPAQQNPHPSNQQPPALNPDGTPVKKKRTRSRKRKSSSAAGAQSDNDNQSSPQQGSGGQQQPREQQQRQQTRHEGSQPVAQTNQPSAAHQQQPHAQTQQQSPAAIKQPQSPNHTTQQHDPTKLKVSHSTPAATSTTPPQRQQPTTISQEHPQPQPPKKQPEADGILRLR
ncbi:MAG: DUF87 domain-containing protein [Chloroflexi bacterium]|nr:MAG: DUF87 domain-containing protein [Chloroflexota bacterium]